MFVTRILAVFIAISVFAPDSASAATTIASLTLTPTSVVSGVSSKGTVALSSTAPWGGASVSLTRGFIGGSQRSACNIGMGWLKSANLQSAPILYLSQGIKQHCQLWGAKRQLDGQPDFVSRSPS
jgi:hypothetical protein